MSSTLKGILPALVTPLNADNSVNIRSFERLLERVYSSGVDGVYICGSTGEGLLLPADARRIVAETAVKSSPAGKQVIAHIGASSIEETLALAKHAASLGVAAISSLPTAGLDPTGLQAFYQQIADAADVPLVAYYFPKFTGFELKFNQLQEIAEIPAVQGIKFTDFDLFTLSLLANEGITVFNGRDEVLAAGLLMGAAGGIGSIYNLLPKQFAELFALARRGHWNEARSLQNQINRLISVLLQYPLIPAIKQSLAWSGIPCGHSLNSARELTPAQQKALRAELAPFEALLAA